MRTYLGAGRPFGDAVGYYVSAVDTATNRISLQGVNFADADRPGPHKITVVEVDLQAATVAVVGRHF